MKKYYYDMDRILEKEEKTPLTKKEKIGWITGHLALSSVAS